MMAGGSIFPSGVLVAPKLTAMRRPRFSAFDIFRPAFISSHVHFSMPGGFCLRGISRCSGIQLDRVQAFKRLSHQKVRTSKRLEISPLEILDSLRQERQKFRPQDFRKFATSRRNASKSLAFRRLGSRYGQKVRFYRRRDGMDGQTGETDDHGQACP